MDQAREDQSIAHFRECCIALGAQETDDGGRNSIRYSYKLFLGDETIGGSLRSYDQSGPCRNLPDMNKIEMVYKRRGVVQDRYYVEWED
jgi:hypothetical protein